MHAAYQLLVKYNLVVAHEVLKYVYAAERLQPPTSLAAVLGTYGTLWARALGRFIGARSCAVGSMPVWACTPSRRMLSSRLERLWGVGRSSGITCSRFETEKAYKYNTKPLTESSLLDLFRC